MGRAVTIGVLDSGVGGLSVHGELVRRLAGSRVHYCCDNANYPYGPKSEEEVIDCAWKAARAFVEGYGLDLLVVACNTASTVALPRIRQGFSIPVVGVVPAIKPAAKLSRTKTVGLLATPGTVSRSYTDDLIREFASHCRVLRQGTRQLVDLAEAKLRGESVSAADVAAEVQPLFDASATAGAAKMDTLVLGCTHFPLLAAEIAAVCPWPVQFVESSPAIASRVEELILASEAGPSPSGDEVPVTACFTSWDRQAESLTAALKARGFEAVEVLAPAED